MPVYLLHFDKSLGGRGRASARHYLGYVAGGIDAVRRRVEDHNRGEGGAKITEAFYVIGARGHLVRVWPAGHKGTERALKRQGRYSDWCPICRTYTRGSTGLREQEGAQLCQPKESIP